MKNSFLWTIVSLCAVAAGESFDIDEDALFADTSLMIDSATVVDQRLTGEPDSVRVTFSGEIVSSIAITGKRSLLDSLSASAISPQAAIVGEGFLDVRLPRGVKAFASLELAASSDSAGAASAAAPAAGYQGGDAAELFLRELFLDVNIARRLYLRAGKQVLQWGRGYFWNPTDLVNVEKKSFIDRIGGREGAFGLKMHAPFGTRANLYSFVDCNDLSSVDSLAAAFRSEVLIGGAETGAGIWAKGDGKPPVFGFDASATMLDVSLTAELSLRHGRRFTIIDSMTAGGAGVQPVYGDLGDTWIPRIAIGAMRIFDLFAVDDRVTAVAELYYNHAGLDQNIFDDPLMVALAERLAEDTTGFAQASSRRLLAVYEPHSHSKHYAAFFLTVAKVIHRDITLTVNGIANLDHRAMILSTGLGYASLHNFTVDFLVNAYLGARYTEYTFDGTGFDARLSAGVAF